jgi:D-lactate dehydrogenase
MNKKITFFDTKSYDRDFFNHANQRHGFDIKFLKSKLTVETMALVEGADAICVFVNDQLPSQVIDHMASNNVNLIALRCAGFNNVDFSSAYKRVTVVRVPAYSPYAVAEHAVALMMALNRKINRAISRTRECNFSIAGLLGFDMHGKTVGIVGTGRIGRALINILKGFGMNVLAYDAYPDKDYASSMGIEYVELNQLFAKSDIISLHCPLTKETDKLINPQTIDLMKPGVMVINTGRGRLIDTKALIDGLKAGKIGYAGLDVYEEENAYFFEDFSDSVISDDTLARLLSFSNVLVTSHQAFFTKEALEAIAEVTLKNISDYFSGAALENEICYQCSSSVCRKKTEGRCFK